MCILRDSAFLPVKNVKNEHHLLGGKADIKIKLHCFN